MNILTNEFLNRRILGLDLPPHHEMRENALVYSLHPQTLFELEGLQLPFTHPVYFLTLKKHHGIHTSRAIPEGSWRQCQNLVPVIDNEVQIGWQKRIVLHPRNNNNNYNNLQWRLDEYTTMNDGDYIIVCGIKSTFVPAADDGLDILVLFLL